MNILDFLRSDGSIVINKKLAHAIGLNNTVIYSELISKFKYWESKGRLIDGEWFFCTIEDLEESTTIKKDKQSRCIKDLEKKFGLIETKLMGLPAKRYFRITDSILKLIENKFSQNAKTDNEAINEASYSKETLNSQVSQNAKTRRSKMRKLGFVKCETNNTNINNTKIINDDDEEYIKSQNDILIDCFMEIAEKEDFPAKETKKIIQAIKHRNDVNIEHIEQATHRTLKLWDSEPITDIASLFTHNLDLSKRQISSVAKRKINNKIEPNDFTPLDKEIASKIYGL